MFPMFPLQRCLASLLILLACLCASAQPAGPEKQEQKTVIVRAARILDVKTGKYLEGQAVLVRGDEIEQIAPASELQKLSGAPVIDLGSATLMPGLIDCHTHLLQNYQGKYDGDDSNMVLTVATMSPASRALLGVKMGNEDLEAGITTVRDLGNSGVNGDVALRDAILNGWVSGPRMIASTRALSAAGGQFGNVQTQAQNIIAQEYVVVGNPNEARDAVQQAFFDGADLIKVIVNSGPRIIAPDTMKAIVDEAHRVHKKVAAHAIGEDAVRIAVDAGVDSIEHGYFRIPDDILKTMIARHIYLVPTDYPAYFYSLVFPSSPPDTFEQFAKANHVRLNHALAMGVPIAFGSDEYYDAPKLTRGQSSLKTLEAYSESGMTPLQVIQAATVNGADLLGMRRLGNIEKGNFADMIAVTGDPLKDVSELQSVGFVMKGGQVVKNKISGAGN
jgi:imidazolonepropionase-like amidohydrolase